MSWRGVSIDSPWTALAGEKAREADREARKREHDLRVARIMYAVEQEPNPYPKEAA